MFRSRIFPLNLRAGLDWRIDEVTYAPVLHVRWGGAPTQLTPMPFQRPSTPAKVGPEGRPLDFTLDDENFNHDDFEMAVFVSEPGGPPGPLFRSGPLRALPASLPENQNGFIQIVFSLSEQTTTAVNAILTERFASGPITTSDPAVKITGASMAANPNNPATWLITLFGTYSGRNPIPNLATLFFRYSAEFSLTPIEDPFDVGRIITTNLGNPDMVFSDAPGGGPVVGLADSFVTSLLNLISTIIAGIVQGQVTVALDEEIARNIRDRVSQALGVPRNADGTPGPLPPNVTISVQESTISETKMTILATVGSFGPVVPTPSGSGCSLSMLFIIAVPTLVVWFAGRGWY